MTPPTTPWIHALVAAGLGLAPGPAAAQAAAGHWASTKPVRPELPSVRRTSWPVNAIDRFVLAALEARGLAPAPRAEPARLLRRAYLDLIGLPPSVEDVDRFLADPSPRAFELVVDRLLASPRYGEHQARPWLDLARYADSNGFQADQLRDSWAYRDWVIDALNQDMGYDRFTIEQLAGDLLPEPTTAQRIATGFHRTVACNVEAGVHPEANRVNQVFDRVNTTATVWLGTTLGCAQCHDHKYDPFTQREYYGLFAFFNNTPLEVRQPDGKGVRFDFWGPKIELPLLDEQRAELSRLRTELAALAEQNEAAVRDATTQQAEWERQIVAALSAGPRWRTLDVATFASTGDEDWEILDDGSVLIGGRVPGTATYTVTANTALRGITALRLETLTHPALPGTGPGRGDEKRPNFILSELAVTARENGEGRPVALRGARADHSQKGFDVSRAIDGDPKTGWAIGGGFFRDHEATFRTAEPVGSGAGATLSFTLDQNFGRGRTIGRFRLSAWTGDPSVLELPDDVRALLSAGRELTDRERERVRAYYVEAQPRVAKLAQERRALERRIDAIRPPTALVMVELDQPRETRVLGRGDYLDPGERVTPHTPAALHPWRDDLPRNRLGLARWLVDPDNPLVARVAVNRWWARIFGRGLVATEEDFGARGDRPTHPGLLDWLAVELVESGWSMKRIIRLIVTSAAYQQSSRAGPRDRAVDPVGALLARGPRFRLSAEAIRDNALSISGLLSTDMGGPPVFPPQPPGLWRQAGRNEPKYVVATGARRFRRGVYVVWRRAAPYPSFVQFDGPDRAACHPRRSRTNTPLQALTLMNDEAYVEMALAFAQRILRERRDGSTADKVTFAFRTALARAPRPDEAAHLAGVFERERARYAARPAEADLLVDGVRGFAPADDVDRAELGAWFFVATILLNLDETITKS